MREKVNNRVKTIKNRLHQEVKTLPAWVRVLVTILLVTGFFLTAAVFILVVKKFKKKND